MGGAPGPERSGRGARIAAAAGSVALLAWLAGCGGAPPPDTNPVAGPRPGDTLFVARSSAWAPPESLRGGASGAEGEAPRESHHAAELVPGFRVQLFQSLSLVEAEYHQRIVRRQLGLPAYVEFRAPFYRVRIGDCVTREAGLELLNRAVQGGYEGADLVETLVTLAPEGGAPLTVPGGSE